MNWPNPKTHHMIVGNLDSQIVFVTLWTPADELVKYVDPSSIALLCPLYSRRRGINYFIRSLLANKNIRHVILTGADLDNSGAALVQLFTHGVKDGVIVDTDVVVDEQIPTQELASLCAHVTLHDVRDFKGAAWASLNGKIAELSAKNLGTYGENKTFELPQVEPPLTFPSTGGGFFIHGNSLLEAQVKLCQRLLRFGEIKRHIHEEVSTKCLSSVHIVVDDVAYDSLLPFSEDDGQRYRKQILAPGSDEVAYTYGKRLLHHFGRHQIDDVISELKHDAYTRKGIMILWDDPSDFGSSSDPGGMYVHVAIVDHKTVLTLHLRDMEGSQGVAHSIYGFRALQEHIAENTGFSSGALHVHVDTCYVDMGATKQMHAFIEENKDEVLKTRHDDPRGNVIISLRDGSILVNLVSQNDEVLGEWIGKTAKEIYYQFAQDAVLFDDYHKFDVGAELQKAEFCLQRGEEYKQDQKL